jgi:hypothetical protein
VKIPPTDLKLIHGETTKAGFSIEVIPDSSFIQNDKLIELTKESYTEQMKSIEKYPVGQDKDLIMEMNRLFKEASKDIKDVDVEKDMKVKEMKFKNEKIKKVSDAVKMARVKLLWGFNKMFVSMNTYLVSEPVKPFRGMKANNFSAASLFNEVKTMILTQVKMKFVNSAIESMQTYDRENISIDRLAAAHF